MRLPEQDATVLCVRAVNFALKFGVKFVVSRHTPRRYSRNSQPTAAHIQGPQIRATVGGCTERGGQLVQQSAGPECSRRLFSMSFSV